MSSGPPTPSNGPAPAARLLVQRVGKTFGRFRKLRVLLDGDEIGTVAHGAVGSFEADPGPHVVQVRMDWVVSHPVAFSARPGGRYDVSARSPQLTLRELLFSSPLQRASKPYTVEVHEQDG